MQYYAKQPVHEKILTGRINLQNGRELLKVAAKINQKQEGYVLLAQSRANMMRPIVITGFVLGLFRLRHPPSHEAMAGHARLRRDKLGLFGFVLGLFWVCFLNI